MRVAISANARPSAVQQVAQRSASSSVFQATPQRAAPVRQETPQIFSVNRRAAIAWTEYAPPLSSNAETRMRMTGKKVNVATSTVTVTTLPAMKPSPLK